MEQAAGVAATWSKELTGFVQQEADKISANDYGLDDLVTAPVELMRIWVRNTLETVNLIPANLAIISTAGSPTPSKPLKMNVQANVPANTTNVTLTAKGVVGQLHGFEIPSADIQVVPILPKNAPPKRTEEVPIRVEVTVNSRHAPNDIYSGFLSSENPPIKAPFRFALSELGEPLR